MNLNRTIHKVAAFAVPAVLAAALMAPTAFAEEPTPGYNNKIPESIMTPDKVDTRIGTLKFFDGIPTKKTAALLRGGLLPQAYVYPPEMRATRDLLRRRLHFVRHQGQLLAHILRFRKEPS